jgi:type III restriction enzyme
MTGGFQLYGFQDDARRSLLKAIRKSLLAPDHGGVVLLKSPTGSGKTVVAGSVIRDLAADSSLDLAFVWLAPFKLQEQSLRTLRRTLGSSQKLVEKDQFAAFQYLGQNDVVFLNWASLNTADKRLIKGSEDREALGKICDATRARNRQIVLIIDESHHTRGTDTSQDVIEAIGPDVVFEMSATPDIRGETVSVDRDEVVEEGLIRKSVRINEGIADRESNLRTPADLDQALLDLAVKKRDDLAKWHREIGADVNPLLLIQVPDAKAGEETIEAVEKRLSNKYKISYPSGRLAKWLSEDSTYESTAPELMDLDGKVEVLLFKQAIATGWDCPRAQVLLKLRDPGKSGKFEVQTIGRIMRMPERKHYGNKDLNDAYVFHPHEEYSPAESFTIVTTTARWRADLPKPSLQAEWMARGVTPFFQPGEPRKIAEKALEAIGVDTKVNPANNKRRLKKTRFKVNVKPDSKLAEQVTSQGENTALSDLETLSDLRVATPEKVVERLFHRFISHCTGIVGNPREVADALYDVAAETLGFSIPDTQAFVVANRDALSEEFIAAVDQVNPRSSRSLRIKKVGTWTPQDPRPYDTEVGTETKCEEVADLDHCAYQPCLLTSGRSNPEKSFEAWLSEVNDEEIKWWMKNGESAGTDFSLVFECNGQDLTFFPDYIVERADGTVGLYETKDVSEAFAEGTTTRAINEAKMAALRDWVAEDPSKRDAAFVVLTPSNSLRWGIDKPPVGSDGNKMADLFS